MVAHNKAVRADDKRLTNSRRQNFDGLRRSGSKPMTEETVPIKWDLFACYFHLLRSKRGASAAVGWDLNYGYDIVKKPLLAKRLELLKEGDTSKWSDQLIKAWETAVERIYVTEALLDKNLHRVVISESHAKRGLADVVAGIRTGYERLGLLKSGTTFINQNNSQAQAGVQAGNGQTAYEIYESEWMRKRKENWDQQLEAAHGQSNGRLLEGD